MPELFPLFFFPPFVSCCRALTKVFGRMKRVLCFHRFVCMFHIDGGSSVWTPFSFFLFPLLLSFVHFTRPLCPSKLHHPLLPLHWLAANSRFLIELLHIIIILLNLSCAVHTYTIHTIYHFYPELSLVWLPATMTCSIIIKSVAKFHRRVFFLCGPRVHRQHHLSNQSALSRCTFKIPFGATALGFNANLSAQMNASRPSHSSVAVGTVWCVGTPHPPLGISTLQSRHPFALPLSLSFSYL